MNTLERASVSDKVKVVTPALLSVIRQALQGKFDDCGETVCCLGPVVQAKTKRGLEERLSLLDFARQR